jgi:hypothetical protein
MAMQAAVSKETQHHTSARRWVMVRAMKSLMRMSEPPLNTNRRRYANAVAGIGDSGSSLDALRTAHTTGPML